MTKLQAAKEAYYRASGYFSKTNFTTRDDHVYAKEQRDKAFAEYHKLLVLYLYSKGIDG